MGRIVVDSMDYEPKSLVGYADTVSAAPGDAVTFHVSCDGAPAFAADPSQDPNNPNCSPGVKGCTANQPTTDHSDANPTKTSTAGSAMSPNCSPGQQGCSANYPTTDHSDANPTKQSTAGQMAPNCTPGQPGCAANYPTTDHSDDNPLKK